VVNGFAFLCVFPKEPDEPLCCMLNGLLVLANMLLVWPGLAANGLVEPKLLVPDGTSESILAVPPPLEEIPNKPPLDDLSAPLVELNKLFFAFPRLVLNMDELGLPAAEAAAGLNGFVVVGAVGLCVPENRSGFVVTLNKFADEPPSLPRFRLAGFGGPVEKRFPENAKPFFTGCSAGLIESVANGLI